MAVIRIKRSSDYTVIPNHVFELVKDAKALGVLCFLLSKPPTWEAKPAHLRDHFGVGRDYIRGALKVLRELGFAILVVDRDDNGKVIGKHYDIVDTPRDGKPVVRPCTEGRENRRSGKPTVGKPVDIVSTESLVSTEEEVSTGNDSASAKISSSSPEPPTSAEVASADDVATPNEFSVPAEWEAEMDALGNGAHPIENAAITIQGFMQMWEMARSSYRVEARWYTLTEQERAAIADHLPEYIEKNPDKRFRMKPENYLKNHAWTEPVIDRRPQSKNNQSKHGKNITFEDRRRAAEESARAAAEAGRRYKERKAREAAGDFSHLAAG